LGGVDSAAFFAEVHLPDDVTVVGLKAYKMDGDPARDISFTFGYRGGTVSTEVATLWSSGSTPGVYSEISTTFNHTIQNGTSHAYYVRTIARGSANAWGNVSLICTRNKIN
jgi:hypothetical protein